jgi:hypothetical protein
LPPRFWMLKARTTLAFARSVGWQVEETRKLLLEVYGMILSGLQGRPPAYGVVWHGWACKAYPKGFSANHQKRKGDGKQRPSQGDATQPPESPPG